MPLFYRNPESSWRELIVHYWSMNMPYAIRFCTLPQYFVGDCSCSISVEEINTGCHFEVGLDPVSELLFSRTVQSV